MSLDPCNCFNPGIGRTSKCTGWGSNQRHEVHDVGSVTVSDTLRARAKGLLTRSPPSKALVNTFRVDGRQPLPYRIMEGLPVVRQEQPKICSTLADFSLPDVPNRLEWTWICQCDGQQTSADL
jgi:hypothetical protein